jgi:hypothetical protein
MTDTPTPIGDEHVAFARAMVALAREHGVDRLDATFSRMSSRLFREGTWNSARITIGWSEGRHGHTSTIGMRAESSIAVAEREAAAP